MGIGLNVLGSRESLSPLDASFLYLERPTELLHVGAVLLLDGPVPFDAIRDVLGNGLGRLRRYRQRAVRWPLDLRAPSWQDDVGFEPARHVHHVPVPAPGDDVELHRTVDALFARPLDHRHPLWETYVLSGLAGGRTAILSKVHHCMIDGVSGTRVLEIMTNAGAAHGATVPTRGPTQAPAAPPSALGRLLAVLRTSVDPAAATAAVRSAVGAVSAVATLARAPRTNFSFNGALGAARRIVWTSFPLDDFLALRGAAGCKVNDVVLAVIAGALRGYLPSGSVARGNAIRALVPVSVRRPEEALSLGNRVSAMFANLPVDVADPVERLRVIAGQMRGLKEQGQQQGFDLVLTLAGAVPSVVSAPLTRLLSFWQAAHTVCTNVPGSPEARYVLGRRVLEMHPIVPLAAGIGLGFAILSYDGRLSICATADAGLVPDADRLPGALRQAADELCQRLGVTPGRAAAVVPAPAEPRVADLMVRDVATLSADAPLSRAWEMMREHRFRHLPVVDAGGHVLGIVTHRDLLAASQSTLSFRTEPERVRLLAWARVGDVMETHLSTAAADEPAAEAGGRMMRHKIGCLPVVDRAGRLVGIVTDEDFLRWATLHMRRPAA